MFKQLVTFVIVLGLVSVAVAVDDFDSYASQAELEARWTDASTNDQDPPAPGTSSAVPTLLTGGYPIVAEGGAAMHVDFDIPGGWDSVDPMDLTMSDRARIELNLVNPIDVASFGSNFELSFYLKPTTDNMANLGDLNVYMENAAGDYSRHILAAPIDEHFQWWFDISYIPACIGDVEQFDDILGNAAWNPPSADYVAKDFIGVGEWGKVVLTIDNQLGWDWGNIPLENLGMITKLIFEVNVDLNMTTDSRINPDDLTDVFPIVGGIYGFDIDDIGIIPEPATIALLGFGGLAMIRVRKKR